MTVITFYNGYPMYFIRWLIDKYDKGSNGKILDVTGFRENAQIIYFIVSK